MARIEQVGLSPIINMLFPLMRKTSAAFFKMARFFATASQTHEHEQTRSPENAQAPQDLVELEQIGFGDLLIGGHNDDVLGKHGGVVPIEASFQDDVVVDDAILGMNRRIRDCKVVDAIAERDLARPECLLL